MDAYFCSKKTREYVGMQEVEDNPLEPGKYLYPQSRASLNAPPEVDVNEVAVLTTDGEWEIQADYRDAEVYHKETVTRIQVNTIGPLPDELALGPLPDIGENEAVVYDDGWDVVPDYRGVEIYVLPDRTPVYIDTGDPLPDGAVLELPEKSITDYKDDKIIDLQQDFLEYSKREIAIGDYTFTGGWDSIEKIDGARRLASEIWEQAAEEDQDELNVVNLVEYDDNPISVPLTSDTEFDATDITLQLGVLYQIDDNQYRTLKRCVEAVDETDRETAKAAIAAIEW